MIANDTGISDHRSLPLGVRLTSIGLFAYLVGACFYVFPSGQPQPADYLMLAVILFSATSGVFRFRSNSTLVTAALFTCVYFSCVNSFYFILHSDDRFILSSLYYFYNAAVMLAFSSAAIIAPSHMRRYIRLGTLLILIIQFIAVLAEFRLFGNRSTGTLNDPNQLGYLIILTIFARFASKEDRVLTLSDMASLSIAVFIILQSQSRSATLGLFIMIVFIMLFSRIPRLWKALGFSLAVGVASYVVLKDVSVEAQFSGSPVSRLIERFQERGPDDSFRGRGYYRLIEHPEYLALGAGEGAYHRFGNGPSVGNAKIPEIHSTWANLLFSYGLVGFGLFVSMLVVVFRKSEIRHACLFLGPAVYGMGTYGARFSMFWVVLGLVYGYSRSNSKAENVDVVRVGSRSARTREAEPHRGGVRGPFRDRRRGALDVL